MTTPNSKAQRGSSLVVAMIAIGVLMVLVVAAIQFTGSNREGAAAKLRSDELAACAESAKRMVMNELNNPNNPLSGRSYNFTLLDAPPPSGSDEDERTRLTSDHYNGVDAGVKVVPVSGSSIGVSSRSARDLSNAAPTQTGFGGIPYRVVMKCRDRDNREAEVEFVFRYGI